MTGKKKAEPPLGAEDLKLWQRVTESAKPLPRRAPAPPLAVPAPKPREKEPAAAKPPSPPQRKEPPPAPRPLPALSPGRSADLDRSTADKLRRGLLPVEARLDLHGHRQEEAHRALDAFVTRAAHAGKRCLLVITGKGNAPGSEGVLRQALPRWLNEAPLRAQILAITEAQPRDGGSGAFYLLLKRKRAEGKKA